MRGTFEEPPTGLIPWFSKTEGNTYATLMHHPFLFKEKTNASSRSSRDLIEIDKQKIKYFWVFWFIDLKIKDCKIVDQKLI